MPKITFSPVSNFGDQSLVCSVLGSYYKPLLPSLILTAKQTFEPSFPGEPIVQKNPVEKPFSIEFPRPDNPSRFTEQPYVSIHYSVYKKMCKTWQPFKFSSAFVYCMLLYITIPHTYCFK